MQLTGEVTNLECTEKKGEARATITLETGTAFPVTTAKGEFALEDKVVVTITKEA